MCWNWRSPFKIYHSNLAFILELPALPGCIKSDFILMVIGKLLLYIQKVTFHCIECIQIRRGTKYKDMTMFWGTKKKKLHLESFFKSLSYKVLSIFKYLLLALKIQGNEIKKNSSNFVPTMNLMQTFQIDQGHVCYKYST